VLVVCRVDLRKFDQPSIRETGGIIYQIDEFARAKAQRRRSRRSGSIRRPDGVQIETEKRVQRPAVIDKFFPYAVLYFLLDVILRPEQFETDAVYAEIADVIVIDRRQKMRLETDLVKSFGPHEAFFEQLAIRRAAVPRLIGADVQVRVDVYREPFVGSVNFAHRFAVRIRNIVAAAERYDKFAVGEALLYGGAMAVVRFFERTVGDYIAGIQNAPAYIKCRKLI